MNRILYEPGEVEGGILVLRDHRAAHIRTVLKSGTGYVLKTGEINGALSEGTLEEITEEQVQLRIEEGRTPDRPPVDLILAMPRPKVLNRLLPQIAALGVDRLVLCNASRVERYYFDTHVLQPEHLRARLVEGLMQSGDTCLPEVMVVRRLRHFLEDTVEEFSQSSNRFLLHPTGGPPLSSCPRAHTRTVLAVGPEGGWLDSEVAGFEERGFTCAGLMKRILRTDTATVAALSCVAMAAEASDA